MMSKHTPGPWRIIEIRGRAVILEPEQDGHVCKISEWADEYAEEQEANARLIAAAPELLEALENLVSLCEAGLNKEYNIEAELSEPRAAIAKATGDQT